MGASGTDPERYGSKRHGSLRHRVATLAIAAGLLLAGGAAARADGDVARGEQLYRGCEDCHSIDKNEVGPMHRGVVGRTAGTVPGYNYSVALKKSNLVWTEDNLDKWLTNPQSLVLGTKMFYKVNDAQDRADLIAFLKDRAK
jgi:cytochrome c